MLISKKSLVMTTPKQPNVQEGMVKTLRSIRDQINQEVKEMTFAEQRAYLDKLLAQKKPTPSIALAQAGLTEKG
jgi:hypothetical protein